MNFNPHLSLNAKLLVIPLLYFIGIGSALGGTRETGNGGGAWVCYNANGTIRWAQSVDLYEAEHESLERLKIERTNLISVKKQVALATAKLLQVDPATFQAVTEKIAENEPLYVPTSMKLYIVDDAKLHGEPDSDDCKGGKIEYGQVANYTNDGRILLSGKFYAAMGANSLTDQAALILHEAVYATLREREKDKDSRRARKIIGYLFSSADPKTYAAEVRILDDSPQFMLKSFGEYLSEHKISALRSPNGCRAEVIAIDAKKLTISLRFLMSPQEKDSEGTYDLCGIRHRSSTLQYQCEAAAWGRPDDYYLAYNMDEVLYRNQLPSRLSSGRGILCIAQGITAQGMPFQEYLIMGFTQADMHYWKRYVDTELLPISSDIRGWKLSKRPELKWDRYGKARCAHSPKASGCKEQWQDLFGDNLTEDKLDAYWKRY